MSYEARVLADSVGPSLVRLTTMQVTFPRIVLAEFNTHRVFSRNSASSRAIPVEKRIAAVEADPFVPEEFGKNQRGMQAGEMLGESESSAARSIWTKAAERAVAEARALAECGVHKQLANRLLEPFSWHTVIVTATEWVNFFALRCHPNAQPEIRKAAEMMRTAMEISTPTALNSHEWHLPLVYREDREETTLSMQRLCQLSTARCARVSYLTHEGKRDIGKDLDLADSLLTNGHMSPFEHPARPMTDEEIACYGCAQVPSWIGGLWREPAPFCGNFRGWVQYRKTIQNEAVFIGGAK